MEGKIKLLLKQQLPLMMAKKLLMQQLQSQQLQQLLKRKWKNNLLCID